MENKTFQLINHDQSFLQKEAPEFFKKEASILTRHWNSVLFFVEGEDVPYYYMRSCTGDTMRSGNIIRLGDEPFKPQTALPKYHKMMVQKAEAPYRKISDEPLMYIQEKDNACLTYTENGMHWVDGPLDINVTFFPKACIFHQDSVYRMCMYHQDVIVEGFFDGKKIIGGGIYDRSYGRDMDESTEGEFHLDANLTAIREDGKKEYCYIVIHQNGKGAGYYCVEDEICITFDDVAMTADWEPLPYCPDTYSFKKAIFTGKDITIHYTGKWGTKGHTQHPRVEMVGFGHMYGDFYLEGTPYTHQMLCSEIEVWNGTKEFLQKAGFTSIS